MILEKNSEEKEDSIETVKSSQLQLGSKNRIG